MAVTLLSWIITILPGVQSRKIFDKVAAMGRNSDEGNSSKAVMWIVLGIVGGLTFFGAGLLVLGVLAYRSLGTSPNTTWTRPSTPVPPPGAVAKAPPRQQNGPAPGEKAPEIEGQDIGGTAFKLGDYHDQVVMLDFWGHW